VECVSGALTKSLDGAFPRSPYFYNQHFCVGRRGFFRRALAQSVGPESSLSQAGFCMASECSGEFLDHKLWWLLSNLWRDRRNRIGVQYIVPVAVLVKWFPDRRGLITGIAVGGFGAGALRDRTRGHAPHPECGRPSDVCLPRHRILLITVAGRLLHAKPSRGLEAEGWIPTSSQASQRSIRDYTLREALRTWHGGRCGCFCSEYVPGISIISAGIATVSGGLDESPR